MKEFIEPDFKGREIELRFDQGEVCIYATEKGLKKLIAICEGLIEKPKQGHIHLEDRDILTEDSLNGVVAIFKQP